MTELTTKLLELGGNLIPPMNMATKEDSIYWQRVQNLRRMVINTENEHWKIMWANKLRELMLNLEKPFVATLPDKYYKLKITKFIKGVIKW